jgi:hypothetical protein
MGVPFTFAGQAGPIPLAELDADFAFLSTGSLSLLIDSSITPSAITVALPVGSTVSAYTTGLTLFVLVANTNTTTTPTINLNGLGAKTIINANTTALTVGQIVAGQLIYVVYDGTNFRIVNGYSLGVVSPTIPFGGGSVVSFNGGPTSFAGCAVVIAGGTNANNVALAVAARSNGEALTVNGQNVTGQSLGMTVIAGTNSSDVNSTFFSADGATQYATINGDGGIVVGPIATVNRGPGTLTSSGTLKSASAVPPAAGGSAACGILASSTGALGIFFGTGAPTFSAAQGSIYSNTTGGAGARLYVNTNGGTTWVPATSP